MSPNLAIPPGEVLAEVLGARGLTQSQLARQMRRPLQVVNEIVCGKKRITGGTALQLAEALGTSADFRMRLESDYELIKARLARQLHAVGARAHVATRAGVARRTSRSAAR